MANLPSFRSKLPAGGVSVTLEPGATCPPGALSTGRRVNWPSTAFKRSGLANTSRAMPSSIENRTLS